MTNKKLFPLGKVVITPKAMKTLPTVEVLGALARHQTGDFGDLSDNDKETNLVALRCGGSILSAYNSTTGFRFFILTEHDRSATTILINDEY